MISLIQILIIVFSFLVIVSFGLYFYFESFLWNYGQTVFCYIAQIFMFIAAIMLIVASVYKLSYKTYKNALVLLYFADVFSLASIFVFAFWPFYRFHEYVIYFNWAAVVSFYVIIALIGLVHVYLIKNPPPATITMTIPVNQLNQTPLQPTFQQY